MPFFPFPTHFVLIDYYVLKYRAILQNLLLIFIHMYPIIYISSHIFFLTIIQKFIQFGMTSNTYESIIPGFGMTGNLILELPQIPMRI